MELINEPIITKKDDFKITIDTNNTHSLLRIECEHVSTKKSWIIELDNALILKLTKIFEEIEEFKEEVIKDALTNGTHYTLKFKKEQEDLIMKIEYKVGTLTRSFDLELKPISKSETEILKSIILDQRMEIEELRKISKRAKYFKHLTQTNTINFTNNQWTNFDELSNIELITFGGDIKVTMDFSVYGTIHGGIRIVMDDNRIFGSHSDYGFDWIIPTANIWSKRSIVRVLPNILAGKHKFTVQAKSQGSSLMFHNGYGQDSFSGGFLLIMEEL